jgi:hypothetical protein
MDYQLSLKNPALLDIMLGMGIGGIVTLLSSEVGYALSALSILGYVVIYRRYHHGNKKDR